MSTKLNPPVLVSREGRKPEAIGLSQVGGEVRRAVPGTAQTGVALCATPGWQGYDGSVRRFFARMTWVRLQGGYYIRKDRHRFAWKGEVWKNDNREAPWGYRHDFVHPEERPQILVSTMMEAREGYRKLGLPFAVISLVARETGLQVVSSSNHPDYQYTENEGRWAGDSHWQRWEREGCARLERSEDRDYFLPRG